MDMKKQTIVALALLLSIPVVMRLGVMLVTLVNPEIVAGHPNYVQNYQLLSMLKAMVGLGSFAGICALWLLICYLLIRSKDRSAWWLFFAALGPFGFAVLAILDDKTPAETDRYARFVRSLNKFVRAGYELGVFVAIWYAAWEAMVLLRNVIIAYQAAASGMSRAQIIDIQNASSGMWAFGELNEVMYIVVLLYLAWPILFNLVGRITMGATPARAR
jgi:hypothetical protein